MLPKNVIANADDFGLNASVNKAILYCYEQGYINSASLMANQPGFKEAVNMVHESKVIQNIGVHVDLAAGRPLTNFKNKTFLTSDGHWDLKQTGKNFKLPDADTQRFFHSEIEAQVQKVMLSGVQVTHIDSHFHLHTLPGFYKLFLNVARQYHLKLRLAQTYNEGNLLKFFYRRTINRRLIRYNCNYTDLFESIDHFIDHGINRNTFLLTEVMLHPDMDSSGQLTDHYLPSDMAKWLSCLRSFKY
jgi:predicted glycoside hydrolase/deacetylase ChbG (UPF0249 family)